MRKYHDVPAFGRSDRDVARVRDGGPRSLWSNTRAADIIWQSIEARDGEMERSREADMRDWGDEYRRTYSHYSDFAWRLRMLVADLLVRAGIDVLQVDARTKGVDSFLGKIRRKGFGYCEPLVEVTDLVGLRVVTYYREDVALVGELIRREFAVDESHSVDKTSDLATAEFGYTGVHYIVTLNEARSGLPEWKPFGTLKAEIQVRTIAQHAWAAVDHKLNYKAEHEVPVELRRGFAALSAMFEVADDRFSELRREHEKLEALYSEYVRSGKLDIGVDRASLAAYLEDSRKMRQVEEVALRLGWRLRRPGADPVSDSADRREFTTVIAAAGIRTIEELDRAVSDPRVVEAELSPLVARLQDAGFPLEGSLEDVASMVVARHFGASETVARQIWSGPFADVLLDAGGD